MIKVEILASFDDTILGDARLMQPQTFEETRSLEVYTNSLIA